MSAHAGMNRFFRLVWNDSIGAWVAVAENARGRGKRSARVAAVLALETFAALGLALPAHAGPTATPPAATQLPTGGNVSAGRATINAGTATLNIDQSTQRAVINWDTFNLGSAAQVNFNQPSSNASTLNRVLDTNPSQIHGKITAPGQVILSNPNGVMFGKSASVDVGGLTATTHGISDADFLAGEHTKSSTYTRNGATGKVVNEGELRAALGGYIALLAPEVRNEGVIVARLGTVALAAGEAITLNFSGNNTLAGITVQPSAVKALVENKGAVLAPGGLIILSARALDRLQGGVVKNSGQLEATGLSVKGGRIVLDASDRIDNSGRISANAGVDGSPAGSVVLTAPEIVNSGSVTATSGVPAAQTRAVPTTTTTGGSVSFNAGTITQKAGGLLDVSGISGGSLKLRATLDLNLEGSLSAIGESGAGGRITLTAGRDATLNNAVVDTSGHSRGGQIHVEAGSTDAVEEPGAPALPSPLNAPDHHPTAALLGSTQLRSASRRGTGGSVALTGEHVELLDHATIDATGATGGGEVRVGGGWQGSGGLRQATQVTQAEGSAIDASATERGDGGTIVLWSDIHRADSRTSVHGSLRANAGGANGNGGQIETSGHWLDVDGVGVQAAAASATNDSGSSVGHAGQWLLDPYDVTISTSANSNISGTYAATGTPSNIQASNINSALNGGTSVTVTTGTSGTTERGDINVNADITKSSGATDVTLTLRAANSIVINNSIAHSGGTGKLNLVFDADNDNGTRDGAGVVILNANLGTGGGSLQFGTGATLAINSVTTKVGGDVYVGGSSAQTVSTAGSSGGGAITVNGEMLIANPSGLSITTGGGNVTFGGLLNAGDSYTNITSANISWTSAYAAAKGATAGGSAVGDTYLATITSRLENAVASRAASYTTAWLGARRGVTTSTATTTATSDNYWRWVTGPEASLDGGTGLAFWLGALAPGAAHNGGYANWSSGEPNNSPASGGTNESAIQFTGAFGRWNDLDPALAGGGLSVNTYLRELNLAASPLSISVGSGTVTFTAMVGGIKALASLNITANTVAINGGGVTTEGLQTYNGAVTLGSAATTLTQTAANTDFTLGASRSITNATGANAALTIRTTGGIVLAGGSSISSVTGSLTPVLNADSDASNGGYIWMQQASGSGASINSNGGAITLSGGADVNTGYAEGRTGIIGNGVTLDTATLNSGGGNIVIRGRSATSGTGYANSDTGTSTNTDGLRMHGSSLINAGAGSIDIRGVARGADASSSNGIETNFTGYTRLLSSSTSANAISLNGDATAGTSTNGWGTFLWGTNTSGILLAATGAGGGVSLNGQGRNTATGGGTHLEPNAYVLAASGPISLTGTKGTASTYEDVVVNGTVGSAASLASGWGIASPVTASSSAITIAADSLSANRVFGSGSFSGSAVQSTGTLTLTPRTVGRALAVQTADPGASVAWIKPASMFGSSGLFKTGFNKIVFGSATTGNVTLDNYSFDNATDLNTGGNAVLGNVGIATRALTVNVTGSGSITDTGSVAVNQLALLGSTSAATLDSAGNAIGTLAANVASLDLSNASALTVGSVGSTNGVTATGTINLATLAGDLTVAQNLATSNTGASAIRLNAGQSTAAGTASGGNVLLSGNPGITTGSGGRATLFSGSVAGSTGVTTKLGSASGRFRYGSDETTTNYSTALGSGLYAIYREQPTLTVTASGASRTYDGVAYSGGNGVGSSGYVNGDTAAILGGSLTYGGSSQGATAAGSYAITPGGYSNGLGYAFSYVNGTLTVNPRVVTFSGTRTYDAGTAIAGSALTVSNAVGSDVVGASGSGMLSGKGVGARSITSLGSIALSGAAAGNYTLGGATGSVTITAANLAVSGVTAANRAYDATTSATLVGTAAVTGLGSDVVSLAGSGVGSFANKNAGVGKAVAVSGYTLTGADAANYSIVQPTGLSATITPASATVTGVSAVNRGYDGTTALALTGSASVAHLGSDVLSVAGSGTAGMADKNAGAGKPVTVSGFTLAGADAPNYSVVQPTGLAATIAPAAITLSTGNVSKSYDGGTSAAGSASVSAGTLFSGDTLTGGSYAFSSKHVGSGNKTVTVSDITLNDGNGGANYSVNYASNTTSTITPAALTVTAPVASKTYDGNTNAGGSATVGSLAGAAAGETVGAAPTLAFTDKNAGSGKTVRASGLVIRDSGSNDVTANYAINYVDNNTGSIAQAMLTVTANADARFVSQTDGAGFNGASYSGLVGGETASVLGGALTITRPGAGTDVSAGTYMDALLPSGLSSGNYSIGYAPGNYTILPANRLLVRINNTSTVYGSDAGFSVASAEYLDADNTTIRALTGSNTGNSYTFSDGAGGGVSFTLGVQGGVTGTGGKTAVGNYAIGDSSPGIIGSNFTTLNFVGNLAVTQKPVTASASGVSKVYDGNTAMSGFTLGLAGTVTGDVLTASGSGAFTQKQVGTGIGYAVTGVTLGGTDGGNYYLTGGNSFTGSDGTITARAVSVNGLGAVGKSYDATAAAALSGTANVTRVGSDDLTLVGTGVASFADKNAGTGKAVTVSGYSLSGADAANYSIVQPVGLTADIAAASLAVTGVSATGKTYDATRNANLAGTAAVTPLGSDTITLSGSGVATFADKNAGAGKTVTVTGYSLSGTDAANYSLVQPTGLTADIAAANVAVTGVRATGKTYDATRNANLTGSAAVTPLGSDAITLSGSAVATFADKNAGTGKAVTVSGYSLSGADAANYSIVQPVGLTADIAAANLAVTGVNATGKTYDATRNANLTGTATITPFGSDTITLSGSGVATFADKNAGTGKAVTVGGYSLSGADAANYSIVQPVGLSADIAAASLAVTGVNAAGKTYDATRNANLTGTATVTPFGSDSITLSGSGVATFADKNAGTGKAVTVGGYSLSGADAANYSIVQPVGLSADIAAASLAVTGVSATGKTYDATRNASLTGTATVTPFGSDTITLSGSGVATFADKNAGTGKAVSVVGYALSGADSANYNLVQPAGLTADIAAASLAVTGVNASGKTYDATRNASLTGTATITPFGSDAITLSGSGFATFADKNAGTGKAVSVSGYSISGTDAANYSLVQPTGLTADIAAASLVVTGVSVSDKTYDTTRNATLAGTAAVTRLGSDDITLAGSAAATFADKGAGTGKAVTVIGYTLTGTDAGNYQLVQPAGLSASISPASLSVSGVSASGKTYDATRTATLTGTPTVSSLGSDDVRISGTGTASFADKNAGAGKAITVSGFALSGADAANYAVQMPTGLSADIAPATLVVTGVTAANKVYDGSNTAALTGSAAVSPLGSDAVALLGSAVAAFTDKNAAAGKTVAVSGYSLSGADAGNYTVVQPASLSASITPRSLNLAYGGVDKVYDGSNSAAVTASDDRVAGDAIAITQSATFADKNAAVGKAITVSGISLSGADAANYSVSATAGATASITPRTLSVAYSGVDKVYDGTTAATVAVSDDRLGGDTLTINRSATFDDRNAGSGKTVLIGGVSLAGPDAGNYSLVGSGGGTVTATANIAQRPVEVSFGSVDKVYDGTATAVLSPGSARFSGMVAGDALSATASATYNDKNAGSGKAVSVNGIALGGTDAANYVLGAGSAAGGSLGSGSISPALLSVNARADSKVYDTTTAASATLLDNRGAGDALTLGYTSAAFADKNAGSGKTVTVSGISLGGADATNYRITTSNASTTADIARAVLTVSASGVDKVYDATTGAQVRLSDNRLGNDALDLSYGAASFADKNAGSGKAVAVTGISVSGADAANYDITRSTATTTADVAKAVLTVSATGVGKVYDASTQVGVLLSDNRLGNDALDLAYSSANTADKNVGSGKLVQVGGITVGGADAANYTVVSSAATTTADVAKAVLTVGATGIDRVYDASTTASVKLSDNRFQGDVLTLNYVAAALADKNAGSAKPVAVSGIALSGADAGNYEFNSSATTTANVAKATLTVGAIGVNQVYNASTAAAVNLTDNRLGNDVLNLSYGSATLADKNAGSGKAVSVAGIGIAGPDAANYDFNTTAATTADVAKASLTVTAAAIARIYDGSTAAQVTLGDNRLAGDLLSLNYGAASFADKNAGSGKAVSVSGIQPSGPDAGNYSVAATASSVGSIAPATLVVNAVAQAKPFDGSTQAKVTLTDNRIPGDALSLVSGGASFANTDIGAGKTVTVGGVRISGGADQGNYVLAGSSITTTSNIDKAVERADTASLPPITPVATLPVLDLTRPVGTPASAALSLAPPSPVTALNATGTTTAAPPGSATATTAASTSNPVAATNISAASTPVAPGVVSLPVKLPTETLATGSTLLAVSAPAPAAPATASLAALAVPLAPDSAARAATAVAVNLDTADTIANITVSLVRPATTRQSGVVTVSVPQSISDAGNGFTFPLPDNVVEAAGTRELRASLLNGDRLPAWLRYVPDSLSFVVSAAPPGALPVQVMVRSGKQRWSVVVSERAGV